MTERNSEKVRELAWAKAKQDVSESRFSRCLYLLYANRRLRPYITRIVKRLEAGEFFSKTLRAIFKDYHQITVGRYSYGCFRRSFPPGTTIGSYVSVAEDVTILRRNHPYTRLTQHPFFYNHELGLVESDTIELDSDNPLTIGSDVWIGRGTLILPGCRTIGDGAIIGANSVVTRDVPAFAIVGGNPAKKIRDRFDPEVAAELHALKWWERSIEELIEGDFPYLDDCNLQLLKRFTLP
ncbi:CatB-related O-acetyltransferase [Ketobacter sp.]|uniref:CatB-related O-acetyltransferase n=1 Tax=Ketobacter sp. TaxID=2083498 RepID=UPI000F205E16|nr:CatB-related O-acetyltransferase [Ketobacter sp.]RLT93670.1 MAG: antibiotic acetyltransferase [Ketobacter sp.]